MPSTRPTELKKFIKKLMENAPDGYEPWLFPVQKGNKAPATRGYSWKSKKALLTPKQAIQRLENRGNVGISGRKNDQLILVDIDDPSIEHELKPTLKIRSRSRLGTHAIYWAHPEDKVLPANLPTDKGEIRSEDQYVVAPGSYVPCTKEELTENKEKGEITEKQKQKVLNDPDRGLYTIDNNKTVNQIKFEELPKVFQELHKQTKKAEQKAKQRKKDIKTKKINEEHSALFDLTITDLVSKGRGKREPHPVHGSKVTGKNWIISGDIGHCWRHLVSLNAIQYLVAKSGYLTCQQAGTAHRNSGAGPSEVPGDNGAIFHAWLEAKRLGAIPENDPVPVKAIHYIINEHNIINEKDHDWKVDKAAYNKALEIIEEEY